MGLKNEKAKNICAWWTNGSSAWFWESTWVAKATLAITSMVKQPKHLPKHTHASTHSYDVGQREILLIVASVSLYVLLLVDVKGLSWFGINTQVFHQGIAGRVDQRNHLQENERDTDTCQRCQKNSLNQWRVIRNGCWKHLSIHFLSPLMRVSCQLPNVHVKHIFKYFINIKICIFTCSKNIKICKKCRTAVHKSLIKM